MMTTSRGRVKLVAQSAALLYVPLAQRVAWPNGCVTNVSVKLSLKAQEGIPVRTGCPMGTACTCGALTYGMSSASNEAIPRLFLLLAQAQAPQQHKNPSPPMIKGTSMGPTSSDAACGRICTSSLPLHMNFVCPPAGELGHFVGNRLEQNVTEHKLQVAKRFTPASCGTQSSAAEVYGQHTQEQSPNEASAGRAMATSQQSKVRIASDSG